MHESTPTSPDLERLILRSARAEDRATLRHLFTQGVVLDTVEPSHSGDDPGHDSGEDLDRLTETYFNELQPGGFWVAELDQRIVGMVGVLPIGADVAEVRRLRVAPDARRMGIGTKLMEQALGFCRDHAFLKVILDTRIEREPAIRLFEKFGFVLSRTRDHNGRKLLDFYIDLYRDPGA